MNIIHKRLWRKASFRLIPCALLAVAGASLTSVYGHVIGGASNHKLISLIGVMVFVVFASAFLHVLTRVIHGVMSTHHLGAGRAASMQFALRTVGYVAIVLVTLDLVGISIEKLLLGSAVLGIILGVAAQQALANFFASVVLILSHPFRVGENVTINSGALGGEYDGLVIDIGLTHTRLQKEDGNIVFLPNATLLSGAAIMTEKTSTSVPTPAAKV